MAYDLHITRKKDWSDKDNNNISSEEWKNLLSEDNSLVATDQAESGSYTLSYKIPLARWGNHYFVYSKGNISISNPDEKTIQKAIKIAFFLHSKIQGDDGEIYADFSELHSPFKSDYRKVREANLPEGFPIIDDINKDAKVVTKMEVLDLHQKEYQNPQAIESYIKPYIEKLKSLSRIIWNGYNLSRGKDFTEVVLEIAIPNGIISESQREKIYELQEYTRRNNIRLVIAEVQ
jgi:hypothetical protein